MQPWKGAGMQCEVGCATAGVSVLALSGLETGMETASGT